MSPAQLILYFNTNIKDTNMKEIQQGNLKLVKKWFPSSYLAETLEDVSSENIIKGIVHNFLFSVRSHILN